MPILRPVALAYLAIRLVSAVRGAKKQEHFVDYLWSHEQVQSSSFRMGSSIPRLDVR